MPRRRDVRRAAALAMPVALGLIVWLLLDDDGRSDADPPAPSGGAAIVAVDALRELAAEAATPIYWAGPPAGAELELSRAADRTYVRYLTGDAEVDDPRPFLTVGSYRLADPVAVLRKQGGQPDGVLARAPRGGVVYFNSKKPESVYLAYPDEDVQIEVFAPSFEQALRLVTAGRIVPAG